MNNREESEHEKQVSSESGDESGNQGWLTYSRVAILSTLGVVFVLSAILVVMVVSTVISNTGSNENKEEVNVLEDSGNRCVVCHRRTTPGIIEQYGHSDKAAAGVSCQDCHEVNRDYPGAVSHQGTFVLPSPTPAVCADCHQQEVREFNQSRHGIPAYAAMWGTENLDKQHQDLFDNIPEAKKPVNSARNALFEQEGRKITKFACEKCHNIGKPRKDGSVGTCQKCHLRHRFDLKQARKPETCNACHIGPDHPQFEIYENSPHGISYHTQGENWNWEAEPGTQTVKDFSAPTCATCHMSGFGKSATTHDVGDRLSWFLFPPISTKRPGWQENRRRMKNVCLTCHNQNFINKFYREADELTTEVNEWVRKGQSYMEPLREKDLLTEKKFDEPIEYEYFELWHHWGRTTKFGAWMLGPDYTQWHGAYEMKRSLSELREMRDEILKKHGYEPPGKDEEEGKDDEKNGDDTDGK